MEGSELLIDTRTKESMIRRPMMWRLFCSQKMEKAGWDFNEYPSL